MRETERRAEEERLIAAGDAGRLDRWLAGALPLSRSRIQALIRSGDIQVDGQQVRPGLRLAGGEVITVHIPPPPPSALIAQDIPVPVLHMDEHLMVVVKPAGMVVHPARGHPDGTLVNALLHRIAADGKGPGDPARPGIVHRLDKGTSGVLVVARTDQAHTHLSAQLAAHTVHRRYKALVWGCPAQRQGRICQPLGRHPRDRIKFAVVEGGKRAVTHYETAASAGLPGAARGGVVSLVRCRLETGRTHQIRVHLTDLGHPLLGDPLYGAGRKRAPAWRSLLAGIDHQLLHAAELGFVHPATGEHVRFRAPLPPDFAAVLDALGLADP